MVRIMYVVVKYTWFYALALYTCLYYLVALISRWCVAAVLLFYVCVYFRMVVRFCICAALCTVVCTLIACCSVCELLNIIYAARAYF